MPNVEWNTLSELRHTLYRAAWVMRDTIIVCEKAHCVNKDSVLRQKKALYYHFLDIVDNLDMILNEVKNGENG